MTLQIDAEFRALIPPLTQEERTQLETKLVAEGCRDALVVWNGLILDGHHRYEICTAKNISYTTVEQACANREEAKIWILRHQLGRRNLNDFQRAELVLVLEPLLAAQSKARMLSTLKYQPNASLAENAASVGKTSARLAAMAGTSTTAIESAICVITRGSPELQEEVRKGKVGLRRAADRVRNGEAIHPPRRRSATITTKRKENGSQKRIGKREATALTVLTQRLDALAKQLHQRRVANDDDMRKSRWTPPAVPAYRLSEILSWIQTALEDLVRELYARESYAIPRHHVRVPTASRQ